MKMPKNSALNVDSTRLRACHSVSLRHLVTVALSLIVLALAPFASAQTLPQCAPPTATPFPNTPLNDLGQGTYSPSNYPAQGGLYTGGYNQRPSPYNAQGINLATNADGMGIVPRSPDGTPDPNGTDPNSKIVMISIGMCNSSMEFGGTLSNTIPQDGFQCRVTGVVHPDTSPSPSPPPCSQASCGFAANWKNPKLVLWDCAQSGMSAKEWAETSDPWTQLDCRLTAAGLTKKQVQIVWLKEALAEPASPNSGGPWPGHALKLKGYLEQILNHLVNPAYGFFDSDRNPTVKMVFLSPRTRAWTRNADGHMGHSPEPYAYETGFADKWVIAEKTDNSHSKWPWLSWGPYIWADGNAARSDGLTWPPSYLRQDCTHPHPTGVHIVANQLLAFFKTDPVATPWFLRKPTQGETPPTITAYKDENMVNTNTTVHFHASATPGGAAIKEYMWTFDDGGYRYDPDNDPLKTNVSRKFPARSESGNDYRVHVTVVDTAGNSATAEIAFPVIQATSQPASVENKKRKVAALVRPKEAPGRKTVTN